MIVVQVHLLSAIDGSVTELARMHICNDGTSGGALRNYDVKTLRGRSAEAFAKPVTQRETSLKAWPSARRHIWNMVAAALTKMNYGDHD